MRQSPSSSEVPASDPGCGCLFLLHTERTCGLDRVVAVMASFGVVCSVAVEVECVVPPDVTVVQVRLKQDLYNVSLMVTCPIL